MMKDSIFFKELAPESFTVFQWVYGQHKFKLIMIISIIIIICGTARMGEWTWEE